VKVLEISTAIGCPMVCRYCAQAKVKAAYKGPRIMTLAIFEAALKNAGSVDEISFAGFAEPFLNSDCSSMIWAATKTGAPVSLYTTAVGMVEADVVAVKMASLKHMTLHLPDAEGHMTLTITDRYLSVVESIVKMMPEVRKMTMGTIHPRIKPIVGDLPKSTMQTRAGNVPGMVQIRNKGALKCKPAPELDHPVLLPDGTIVICCQDYSVEHPLGNLATQTWREIYAGEPFKALKNKMASASGACLCRTCDYAESA
jgi:organic radical activating enzyme